MTNEIGVYVLGTGQSGTSAASRLVNLLGVPTSTPDDVMTVPTEDNPKGYWESSALLEINEELLALLGGSGRATPRLAPGWEKAADLEALRERAGSEYRRVFPTEQWVWKDPRNSTTLPFWRCVREANAVAVVVSRNPLEVVSSLERHLGATKHYGLARWEQRSRDLLRNLEGLPAIFMTFERLLGDPVGWSQDVAAFLSTQGVDVREPAPHQITEFVEPSFRHAAFTDADIERDPDISEEQTELARVIRELEGAHTEVAPQTLPRETPWADLVMAEYRTGYVRALEDARSWLDGQVRSWQTQAEEATAHAADLQRRADELERRGVVGGLLWRATDRFRRR